MSELISDDAKKSATRADVMMLAATTEAEFSKLRSWISARFDTISSENTSNTDRLLRHNTFQHRRDFAIRLRAEFDLCHDLLQATIERLKEFFRGLPWGRLATHEQ